MARRGRSRTPWIEQLLVVAAGFALGSIVGWILGWVAWAIVGSPEDEFGPIVFGFEGALLGGFGLAGGLLVTDLRGRRNPSHGGQRRVARMQTGRPTVVDGAQLEPSAQPGDARSSQSVEPHSLPTFRYHPDPVASGSVVESDITCECCGRARGWIYSGPVHAKGEGGDESVCPWCIANGSAHDRLGVSFSGEFAVGGGGQWEPVARGVIEEVIHRTPGFTGWQQEQWWTHCGDAASYLGRAGRAELESLGIEAIEAVRRSTGLEDGPEWHRFFSELSKQGSPTAYVFRCSHCGALGGYQDCD